MAGTHATRVPPPRPTLLQNLLDDRVLLSAFVVCILLIGYQLSVTLLQPPWIKPVTDWLRTGLAWPQLLVVVWVAVRLLRTQQPGALAWSCAALGLLSYAIARTTWTIADVVLYPHGVPFPSLPDLFFILQYPCFFMALIFTPALALGHRLPGLRTLVDGLLWMSAITALVWYFVLLPISLQTGESPLAKQISIGYQVGDLVLFYGCVMALARPYRRTTRLALSFCLLSAAAASLFIADTWATLLLFHPQHTYRTGSVPDLFWFTCYLLIPVAAVVRLRVTPAELPPRRSVPSVRLSWRNMLAVMKFIAPSVAVVAASMVIIIAASLKSRSTATMIGPELLCFALLLLALLRPAVLFVEQEQLRRERDMARAQESALRLAHARMETFLNVLAHEMRTPLTVLVGNVHLMARRLDALMRPDTRPEDYPRIATVLRTLVQYCEHGLQRMERLVEDVVDETRIRRDRLALRLESCDLAAVVGEAVAEQRALNPDRFIRWVAETSPVLVLADASRIEQVVANYASNALKFSRDDQAVNVRLCTKERVAWVSVHDDGVGVPLAEQPHIWEKFYQAEGAKVQSGSHIGMGIGLYISKAIIDGHHGQVGIESAPHQGTTFWFTLPLAAGSPKEEATSRAALSAPNDDSVGLDGRDT
jgi:signal transduction histidine kinase